MAFVVEDGTGLPNATSYESVAELIDFHTDRGNDLTTYTDAQLEQALIRGTDYIDKRFANRFKGIKGSSTQALEFPRTGLVDPNGYTIEGIPQRLKYAVSEYSFIALSQIPLSPTPNTNPGTPTTKQGVKSTSITVGPIKTATVYDNTSTATVNQVSNNLRKVTSGVVSEASLPEYPIADLYLEPYLNVVNLKIAGLDDPIAGVSSTGGTAESPFVSQSFDNEGNCCNTRNTSGSSC